VHGEIQPMKHQLVFPSTGNFGIGGAWVGPRMGTGRSSSFPKRMSRERFEKIRGFGAQIIATPGASPTSKRVFDKVKELRENPENAIIEQFSEFGNYRFHATVTAAAVKRSRLRFIARASDRVIRPRSSPRWIAERSARAIALKEKFSHAESLASSWSVSDALQRGLRRASIGGHRHKHVTWIHKRAQHGCAHGASMTWTRSGD